MFSSSSLLGLRDMFCLVLKNDRLVGCISICHFIVVFLFLRRGTEAVPGNAFEVIRRSECQRYALAVWHRGRLQCSARCQWCEQVVCVHPNGEQTAVFERHPRPSQHDNHVGEHCACFSRTSIFTKFADFFKMSKKLEGFSFRFFFRNVVVFFFFFFFCDCVQVCIENSFDCEF